MSTPQSQTQLSEPVEDFDRELRELEEKEAEEERERAEEEKRRKEESERRMRERREELLRKKAAAEAEKKKRDEEEAKKKAQEDESRKRAEEIEQQQRETQAREKGKEKEVPVTPKRKAVPVVEITRPAKRKRGNYSEDGEKVKMGGERRCARCVVMRRECIAHESSKIYSCRGCSEAKARCVAGTESDLPEAEQRQLQLIELRGIRVAMEKMVAEQKKLVQVVTNKLGAVVSSSGGLLEEFEDLFDRLVTAKVVVGDPRDEELVADRIKRRNEGGAGVIGRLRAKRAYDEWKENEAGGSEEVEVVEEDGAEK